MDLNLRNKAVLIAGASEGMGRGAALVFAEERARLALVARTEANLEKVAKEVVERGGPEPVLLPADLINPSSPGRVVASAIAELGGLDAVVNTVGLCERSTGLLSQDDDMWQRSFDSVLMVAVRIVRAALPALIERGNGSIVNVGAMSIRHWIPDLAHYSAQKAALAHFTKNVAREFASKGIRANAVLPGMIRSESVGAHVRETMEERGWDERRFFEYVNDKYHHCTWADRIGEVEEVGRVVAFLVSDAASYVNGALVNVDGGSDAF